MARPKHRSRAGWAVTAAALGVAAAGTLLYREPALALLVRLAEQAPDTLRALAGRATRVVAQDYARSPEAVLGLAAALALPVVGMLAALCRWFGQARLGTRLGSRLGFGRDLGPVAEGGPFTGPPSPRARAWLALAGGGNDLPIQGEICRIGSSPESDVALDGPSLQATHALIQRTPEAEFVIIDICGEAGPGLTVNGGRFARCTLRDGDRIELGGAAVIFHRAGARSQRATWTEHHVAQALST